MPLTTRARCMAALLVLASAVGCATGPSGLLRSASPYESYVATLKRSGLDTTALGRDWVRAGDTALQAAAATTLPFTETGYFPPESPSAAAYRMPLSRGRRLLIEVTFVSAQPGGVFVDLFEAADGGALRRVASLEPGHTTLAHDVRRDATYVLRIQPELLRGGRYTLVQRTLSTLLFPVPGHSAAAVQSGFGAARDAGTRGHEGVDIFAARGTPVAAVVDGVAQASTNGLGGNVVWLRDARESRTFYYAHLDGWAIDGTVRVKTGDVLGHVGNTGNARTTAPHLHFGIYEGGAIDPLPFLQPDDPAPRPPRASPERLWERVRVSGSRVALREGPASNTAARAQLAPATVARVTGVSQAAVRLHLPDGTVGYVDAAAVIAAAAPLRRARLAQGVALREGPAERSPIVTTVTTIVQAEVLGQFAGYELVRVPEGDEGWVKASAR